MTHEKINHATGSEVDAAIAALAKRVRDLEVSGAGGATGVIGNGEDAHIGAQVIAKALGDLKRLRTAIVTAGKEIDSKLDEMKAVQAENEKLRYQIKHLKRSLETEEEYVAKDSEMRARS